MLVMQLNEVKPNLQALEQASFKAVDYFVWALKRLYERGEERYVRYLWQTIRLVQDIHDRREAGYGVKSRSMRRLWRGDSQLIS